MANNDQTAAINVNSLLSVTLGDSDDLIALLLNSTGEGIYGTDLDGTCIFANPACVRILGFESDADLLGTNMHELVHHTRGDGSRYHVEECNIYRAFWQHEGVHVDDEVMWCADGNSFCAEYWSYPVERDGNLIGCVVTFTDITERRQVEDDLRETESFVRLLLNSTGEGIYGTDLDGNCTFANSASASLLGFESDEELIGKPMHQLVHHTRPNGDPYPVEECQIYTSFRERRGSHVDDEVMWRKDGARFMAEYWSFPIEKDGELIGSVVTFVDITQRRTIEEELRQTEKMAALGKLSAGLAHELNNPAAAAARAASQLGEAINELQIAVSSISRSGISSEDWQSFINWELNLPAIDESSALQLSPIEVSDREDELIAWLDAHGVENGWDLASSLVNVGVRKKDLGDLSDSVSEGGLEAILNWCSKYYVARDLANVVRSSSASISSLVDSVKSYSYMDQAPIQEIDVHRGLEDTIRILNHRLTSDIKVIRDFDRELPHIEVRGSELNQVWTNLIDNSISAIEGTGTIILRTSKIGPHVVVEVQDNGAGIPEDIQSQVFDPFFTTKDVGEGTGLGLDVTRRIVTERCGGEIMLTSRPGETVFRIVLPIRTGIADEIS
jgi:PAS domain S-box-containing protein